MCGLLIATSCFLYRGATELGFFHVDDPTYVVDNPHIRGATLENLTFILTQPYFANYSPLHLLSYMLDHAIGGLDPRTFHVSSHVWTGLAACGVYFLAWVLLRRRSVALAVAVAFLAHPAHVEAVAWISSRKDLVAAAFALPAMAAYLIYRRGGRGSRVAYAASLVLFLLGVAGKLSVVVLPGILFLFDWFAEGRRDRGMVLDKLPYAMVATLFVLRVWGVQPSTRQEFEFFVFGHSTLYNLWLLGGGGDYVLMRPRPESADYGAAAYAIASAPFLLAVVPLLLQKWLPGVVVALFYFVLLALVPSQMLSFIHPVTDRYLFFPSVGVVLLLGWLGLRLTERLGRPGAVGVLVATLLVVALWGHATLGYLSEWQDPRSVWFGASRKSDDINVFQYLGSHYQDAADELTSLSSDADKRTHAARLARTLWEGDQRLEPLLQEWGTGALGSQTEAYKNHLYDLAYTEYERALATRSTRLVPNLYFRIAKLAADRGDLERAKSEFRRALTESQKHTSSDVREQLEVMCQNALGLVYWREGNYPEALEWLRRAEAAQLRVGANWVPQIAEHRARLERIVDAQE